MSSHSNLGNSISRQPAENARRDRDDYANVVLEVVVSTWLWRRECNCHGHAGSHSATEDAAYRQHGDNRESLHTSIFPLTSPV
jgi:hypothetical protein